MANLAQARLAKEQKKHANKARTNNARAIKTQPCASNQQDDSINVARMHQQIQNLQHENSHLQSQISQLEQQQRHLHSKLQTANQEIAGLHTLDNMASHLIEESRLLYEKYQLLDNLPAQPICCAILFKLFKSLNKFLCLWNIVPSVPIKIRKHTNRGIKAIKRSAKWVMQHFNWHTDYNAQSFKEVFHVLLDQHSNIVFKYFHWKKFQLSTKETNELQMKLNITPNQMRLLQRMIRSATGKILLSNERNLRKFQQQFLLSTTEVHQVMLCINKYLYEKHKQPQVKMLKVCHSDLIEAFQCLCAAACHFHRLKLPWQLPKTSIIGEIGWDKSNVGGLAESVGLNLNNKSHGMYGSLVTTLTNDQVAENYNNLRELSKNWNKQEITNGLLRWPVLIFVVQYVFEPDNDEILSKRISPFVMMFNDQSQEWWNEHEANSLTHIDGPPKKELKLRKNKIERAMVLRNKATQTDYFWLDHSCISHPFHFCIVKPPGGFHDVEPDHPYENLLDTEAQNIWERVYGKIHKKNTSNNAQHNDESGSSSTSSQTQAPISDIDDKFWEPTPDGYTSIHWANHWESSTQEYNRFRPDPSDLSAHAGSPFSETDTDRTDYDSDSAQSRSVIQRQQSMYYESHQESHESDQDYIPTGASTSEASSEQKDTDSMTIVSSEMSYDTGTITDDSDDSQDEQHCQYHLNDWDFNGKSGWNR